MRAASRLPGSARETLDEDTRRAAAGDGAAAPLHRLATAFGDRGRPRRAGAGRALREGGGSRPVSFRSFRDQRRPPPRDAARPRSRGLRRGGTSGQRCDAVPARRSRGSGLRAVLRPLPALRRRASGTLPARRRRRRRGRAPVGGETHPGGRPHNRPSPRRLRIFRPRGDRPVQRGEDRPLDSAGPGRTPRMRGPDRGRSRAPCRGPAAGPELRRDRPGGRRALRASRRARCRSAPGDRGRHRRGQARLRAGTRGAPRRRSHRGGRGGARAGADGRGRRRGGRTRGIPPGLSASPTTSSGEAAPR